MCKNKISYTNTNKMSFTEEIQKMVNYGLKDFGHKHEISTQAEFDSWCKENSVSADKVIIKSDTIYGLSIEDTKNLLKLYPTEAMAKEVLHYIVRFAMTEIDEELDKLALELTPVDYIHYPLGEPGEIYICSEFERFYLNPYLQSINLGHIKFAEKLYQKGFRLETLPPDFVGDYTFDWSTYIESAAGVRYLVEKHNLRPNFVEKKNNSNPRKFAEDECLTWDIVWWSLNADGHDVLGPHPEMIDTLREYFLLMTSEDKKRVAEKFLESDHFNQRNNYEESPTAFALYNSLTNNIPEFVNISSDTPLIDYIKKHRIIEKHRVYMSKVI